MSLLPNRFQEDPLPSLGKLVARAIAPVRDPIKEFETGDHGVAIKFIGYDLGSALGSQAALIWYDGKAIHQEVITPADLYVAPKEEMAGGWIEWSGGNRPVSPETKVEVMFRQRQPNWPTVGRAGDWFGCWECSTYSISNIVAYRVLP